MAAELHFGILLPSFSSIPKFDLRAETLRDCAQQAEGLGFASLWVIDHFLKAPVYGTSWLDPMLALTYVAAHTTRVKLGTSVLIVPLRNPVLLAKEVATLQHLSGQRFILGLGVGWNPVEFEAVQVPRRERGRRTDEIMEIVRRLLSQRTASYEGRYYRFPEIAIEPFSGQPTPIWVGGGAQPNLYGSSEVRQRTPEAVIQRIARADGWSCVPQATDETLREDWGRIQAAARAMGRDPAAITFAHMSYLHLVDTDDRERAYAEQKPFFDQYMGEERPWDYVRASYLVGSVSDIVARLKARIAIGARHIILGPITTDPRLLGRQLSLYVEKLLPQLQG